MALIEWSMLLISLLSGFSQSDGTLGLLGNLVRLVIVEVPSLISAICIGIIYLQTVNFTELLDMVCIVAWQGLSL